MHSVRIEGEGLLVFGLQTLGDMHEVREDDDELSHLQDRSEGYNESLS